MDHRPTPRTLTHDEQKAAEAAFAGRPFNPAWSASARRIYDGLRRALPQAIADAPMPAAVPGQDPLSPAHRDNNVSSDFEAANEPVAAPSQEGGPAPPAVQQEGLDAGMLIDVTDDAKRMGLAFPVVITKPLWDIAVATSQDLPAEERAARLRDILMAFRLRLATHATLSPLIDFPALLAMPPDHIPQPIPLFALIQPDEDHRAVATLLLPNEVSTTIIPMN